MDAKQKAPSYQWYSGDYATDESVMLMTYEQEGVYRRLLDHQSLHGGLPVDPAAIARLVPKMTAQRFLSSVWPTVEHKFPEIDGRRINHRMARAQREFEQFLAAKRESGRLGGLAKAEADRQRKLADATSDASHDASSDASDSPVANTYPSSSSSTSKEQIQDLDRWFERWYAIYPRHVGKEAARRAFRAAFRRHHGDVGLLERMIAALGRQRLLDGGVKFCPHPATWLNGDRWLDEVPAMQADAGEFGGWVCPHKPHCAHRKACRFTTWKELGSDPETVEQIA